MRFTFELSMEEYDEMASRGYALVTKTLETAGGLVTYLAADKNFLALCKHEAVKKKKDEAKARADLFQKPPRKKRTVADKPKRTRISKKEKEAALTELAAEKKLKV